LVVAEQVAAVPDQTPAAVAVVLVDIFTTPRQYLPLEH
jgi:hypothetical protein